MSSYLKVGNLYKLNPKYDNSFGKMLYESEKLNNGDNFLPQGPGYKDPWNYACINWYVEEPILILEKDIQFPYVKDFNETLFIKVLFKKNIYYFPYSIYMRDVLILCK